MLCCTGLDISAYPNERYGGAMLARINRSSSHKMIADICLIIIGWFLTARTMTARSPGTSAYRLLLVLSWFTLRPWRWILYVVQKRRIFSKLFAVRTNRSVLYTTVVFNISQKNIWINISSQGNRKLVRLYSICPIVPCTKECIQEILRNVNNKYRIWLIICPAYETVCNWPVEMYIYIDLYYH